MKWRDTVLGKEYDLVVGSEVCDMHCRNCIPEELLNTGFDVPLRISSVKSYAVSGGHLLINETVNKARDSEAAIAVMRNEGYQKPRAYHYTNKLLVYLGVHADGLLFAYSYDDMRLVFVTMESALT